MYGPRLVPMCRIVHVDAQTSPSLNDLRETYFGVGGMPAKHKSPAMLIAILLAVGAVVTLLAMAIALHVRRSKIPDAHRLENP